MGFIIALDLMNFIKRIDVDNGDMWIALRGIHPVILKTYFFYFTCDTQYIKFFIFL